MTEYTPTKLFLSPGQLKKLEKLIYDPHAITFGISATNLHQNGNKSLPLTQRQTKHLSKQLEKNKGIRIKLSEAQVKQLRSDTKNFIKPIDSTMINTKYQRIEELLKKFNSVGLTEKEIKELQKLTTGKGLQVDPHSGTPRRAPRRRQNLMGGLILVDPATMRPPPFIGSWSKKKNLPF